MTADAPQYDEQQKGVYALLNTADMYFYLHNRAVMSHPDWFTPDNIVPYLAVSTFFYHPSSSPVFSATRSARQHCLSMFRERQCYRADLGAEKTGEERWEKNVEMAK